MFKSGYSLGRWKKQTVVANSTTEAGYVAALSCCGQVLWIQNQLLNYGKELCNAFEKLMHEKFQMSFIGELIFFLGLQVKQKNGGIFICQDKYVAEILKKFRFTEVKNASTLMETQKPLLKDKDSDEVEVYMYRLMIGLLMYLTSSRPDIMFAVFAVNWESALDVYSKRRIIAVTDLKIVE
nr:uncharacterized mitochondrial protein AtMg00810-like [Tanacetum cinerariifolium]